MDAVRMHAPSPEQAAIVDAVLDYSRRRMLATDVPLDKPQSEAELNRLVGRTITDAGLGAQRALSVFEHILAPACLTTSHPLYLSFIPTAPTTAAIAFDLVVSASGLYGGSWLEGAHPQLGTTGPQLLVWGFFVSTIVLFHATVTINSLAHRWGTRRFATRDDSRNNAFLALITFGEGWHNNHHHFPGSARQGFAWYELDLTYLGLRAMALLGLVRDLKPVPPDMRTARPETA